MAVRGGLPFDWWLRRGGARCERGEKEGGGDGRRRRRRRQWWSRL